MSADGADPARNRECLWSRHVVALLALLTLCACVYYPGLAGGFLFDDFANLPALGRFGPVDNVESLLLYMFSGIADQTGRPVAMLSFLLDANHWPAPPWGFKRTNLCIHLVNAVLLSYVLRRLGERGGLASRRALYAALIGAGLWALHPLWVSTVLYVVQRHALLATTFVFAGILVWLASERAFSAARVWRGWFLALASILVCGLAAGLSKPNGFLLPLLLLACAPAPATGGLSRQAILARRWLLIVPSLLILAALGYLGVFGDAGSRPWSVGERLLTQPRVIFDYLRLLILPNAYSSGVFADDYRVSTGLWQPFTTLPAVALLLAAAIAALARRREQAWLAAGLLFYLAGHLFESTVIPLELYFEHRNYLPAALLFWPLGVALATSGGFWRWRLAGTVIALALCAALTLMRATLWGDPLALALNWANDFPTSARAQANAASELAKAGRGDLVVQRLQPLFDRNPAEMQYAVSIANARCQQGGIDAATMDKLVAALSTKGVALDLSYHWMIDLVRGNRSAPCGMLAPAAVHRLVLAVSAVAAEDVEARARLHRLLGYHALRERRCDEALAEFNGRLDLQRRPEGAIEQVGALATQCSPAHGLRHLEHYKAGASRGDTPLPCCALRVRDWLQRRQGYWDREFERLERVLREDAALPPLAG